MLAGRGRTPSGHCERRPRLFIIAEPRKAGCAVALIARHPSTVSSAPQSGVTSLLLPGSSVIEQPALTLRRLSRVGWSGRVSWEMERGLTQVWLQHGQIVWGESSRQHRGLGHVLSELL